MNLFPNNEKRTNFGCKEVPDLKISLVENDKIVYEIILDSITYYYYSFGENKYLKFNVATINDKDYVALVSKMYDKYFVDTRNYWRSADTGKDEIIEVPTQVFTKVNLTYQLNNVDPAKWEFIFRE